MLEYLKMSVVHLIELQPAQLEFLEYEYQLMMRWRNEYSESMYHEAAMRTLYSTYLQGMQGLKPPVEGLNMLTIDMPGMLGMPGTTRRERPIDSPIRDLLERVGYGRIVVKRDGEEHTSTQSSEPIRKSTSTPGRPLTKVHGGMQGLMNPRFNDTFSKTTIVDLSQITRDPSLSFAEHLDAVTRSTFQKASLRDIPWGKLRSAIDQFFWGLHSASKTVDQRLSCLTLKNDAR